MHARRAATPPLRVDAPPCGSHRAVLLQQLHLRVEIRVEYSVRGEHISALPEEVVAQKGVAGAVGEDDGAESRCDGEDTWGGWGAGGCDAPAVAEEHRAFGEERAEDAGHLVV